MNDGERKEPTRRTYLQYGSAIIGGGLLAGCIGDEPNSSPDSTEPDEGTTSDDGGAETSEEPEQETSEDPDSDESEQMSYSVSMEPVGTVEFDAVPETWESYFPGYADMGVALGQAEGLTAVGVKSRYHTQYYDELESVELDFESVTEIYDDGVDKELYYELGNDVHLTDPQWLINNAAFGLDESDVEELTDNVAPFIGNTNFRRTDPWHEYRYYDMYEAFEVVAQIFRKEEQYAAFKSYHDEFIAEIQAELPAADQRPSGLLCFAAADEPEAFYPYRLTDKGTNKKHFRDLGIGDALAGTGVEGLSTSERGTIDYETLLDVDPEALFVRGHETKSRAEFEDTVLAFMQDHGVASDLTAVQDEAVYRGGPIYQGPIQNLFLTERFATLVFPDAFSGELFDRSEAAAIVNGDF